MVGIYKITSPSGKVYIGQSIDIENRWKHYKYPFRKKTKVYKSLQKYGTEKHIFEVIEECSIKKLNKRETYWKQYYLDKFNGDWKNVLFHELFDLGGGPKSKIMKQKISEANKGKAKPSGFGERISKPILQYSLEGHFIKEWDSLTEAKNSTNGDVDSCLSNKQKTAGGYIWKYKTKNYPLKIEIELINGNKNKPKSNNWKKTKYKSVYQYSLEGEFIKKWNSLQEISKELGIYYPYVSSCCKGKTSKYKDCFWSFNKLNKKEIREKIDGLVK